MTRSSGPAASGADDATSGSTSGAPAGADGLDATCVGATPLVAGRAGVVPASDGGDDGARGPGEDVPVARVRNRRSLVRGLVLLTLAVLAADQVTKMLAEAHLVQGERVPLLGDLVGLTLVYNSGAAFSLAEGKTWIFTIAAVVVTVIIVRVANRLGSRAWAVSLGALLGGNLGNLYDRLFRPPGVGRGHVVDFINYLDLFVGNVADIAIVLGALAVALLTFRGIGVDGEPVPAAAATDAVGGDPTVDPTDTTGDTADATGGAADPTGDVAGPADDPGEPGADQR